MRLSRPIRPVRPTLPRARVFTLPEAACLLDLSVWTVEKRIQAGQLRMFTETTFPRYPGWPHACKRVRRYIRGEELERYLKIREEEHQKQQAARAQQQTPEGRRAYWRRKQQESRERRRERARGKTEAPPRGGA